MTEPEAVVQARLAAEALQGALDPVAASSASAEAAGSQGTASFTPDQVPDPFYITTAIAYTNGDPHMGHAYEIVTTDALARYHKRFGRDVYFLTGSDEHGQKIADKAAERGCEPIDICTKYANAFKDLYGKLNVSNDRFIRTTEDDHIKTSQWMWEKCKEDIYLGQYSGWYNVREEMFVTETEAEATDFKDPSSGKPLEKREESSYFFKMSKYYKQLLEHIKTHPEFIQPAERRAEILERLKEPLRDLSTSRTTFSWGIPVPGDDKHVMYVWFDALTNYLTGINLALDPEGPHAKRWPAAVQVIGKDITWFHTVIWPCMLLAAGLELPKCVFAHGFVLDENGRKMSKSAGNVVDPYDVLKIFPADSFRYFLIRECHFGSDLPFSYSALCRTHNSVLADGLGNLVHRAANLCKKYCEGKVPDVASETPFDFESVRERTEKYMAAFNLRAATELAIECVSSTNKYLTVKEPWKSKDAEDRQRTVRTTLEALYICAHILEPAMPTTCAIIFERLGTPPSNIRELTSFGNLTPGTTVSVGDILFQKVELPDDLGTPSPDAVLLSATEIAQLKQEIEDQGALVRSIKAGGPKENLGSAVDKLKALKAKLEAGDPVSAAAAADAKAKAKEKSKSKGKGKGKQPAAAAAAAAAPSEPEPENLDRSAFGSVEVRVGKIVEVWEHPDSDKLWCEKIDLGEEGGPRQIGSGLRKYYSQEGMLNRRVLVVCNLKAAKLGGFPSSGMVLCAKNADGSVVEFVDPPEGAAIGERVTLQGLVPNTPASASQMKKRKLWEAVAAGLKTNAERVACFQDTPLIAAGQPCVAPTLPDAPVS